MIDETTEQALAQMAIEVRRQHTFCGGGQCHHPSTPPRRDYTLNSCGYDSETQTHVSNWYIPPISLYELREEG